MPESNDFEKMRLVDTKRIRVLLIAIVLVLSAANAYAGLFGPFDKNAVYKSNNGASIKIISSNEMEIEKYGFGGGTIVLASYSVDGKTVRVLYKAAGVVEYYEIVKDGLKEKKTGEFFYTKVALEAKQKAERAATEAKLRAEQAKQKAELEAERIKPIALKALQIDNEGIITDSVRGLQWYVGPDEDTNWDQANSWVHSLSAGGGWRMPTKDELKGIFPGYIGGSTSMHPMFKTRAMSVWSGEPSNSSSKWSVSFRNGNDYLETRSNSGSYRAFAVRSKK
jgi:hypothetical protein